MADTGAKDLVGSNLRQARARAQLSLSRTAELTGVSKAMLGQIERGESSPTLATLWKLCNGLRLPLSALIGLPTTRSILGPVDETIQGHFTEAPVFKTLFPFDPKTGCEVFLLELSPHWEHLTAAHSEGVIEDIFVLEGAIEILAGESWLRVESGQALRFNADKPHGYRNPLAKQSRFHNTIYYPAQLDAALGV